MQVTNKLTQEQYFNRKSNHSLSSSPQANWRWPVVLTTAYQFMCQFSSSQSQYCSVLTASDTKMVVWVLVCHFAKVTQIASYRDQSLNFASTDFGNTGWHYFMTLMPVGAGPFLKCQLGELVKVFVNGHINGRGTTSLRTNLRLHSSLIVTGITVTHLETSLCHVQLQKKFFSSFKIRVSRSCY